VAGDQSDELARRAYVYVGRGGARRGHARGDRPGRRECRRGGRGDRALHGGPHGKVACLPARPCARAGRAPTGAARRIARISGRDAPACPPLRPSIFSAIDRSLSSGHGPGLGGWLTDSASPAVVRGREARGHALMPCSEKLLRASAALTLRVWLGRPRRCARRRRVRGTSARCAERVGNWGRIRAGLST